MPVKKLLVVLVVLAVILAGAAFAINRTMSHRPAAEDYTTAPVEYGSLSETISATGQLQPEETLVINTAVPGRVVQVNADVNQTVEEGDVLARLDDRLAQDDLRKAQVGVDMANIAVTRARDQLAAAQRQEAKQRSLPEDVGRKLDLESAQDQVKAAQAGVSLAQAQVQQAEEERDRARLAMQFTVIRVPVIERPSPGSQLGSVNDPSTDETKNTSTVSPNRPKRKYTVLDRKVVLNQIVSPASAASPMLGGGMSLGAGGALSGGAAAASQPTGGLFTLAGDLARMRIRAQVAEGDVSKVHKGQAADFTVSTYAEEDRHFHGTVAEVHLQPNSVQGAVYYEALIDVPNERDPQTNDWRLRPGMTASVDIVRKKQENIWKLPIAALSVQVDERQLSKAAKDKLDKPPGENWRPIWVVGPDQKPWPVFVRLGELRDSSFQQVAEWDTDLQPRPDPKVKTSYPRVITVSPAGGKEGGLFKSPPIRF